MPGIRLGEQNVLLGLSKVQISQTGCIGHLVVARSLEVKDLGTLSAGLINVARGLAHLPHLCAN